MPRKILKKLIIRHLILQLAIWLFQLMLIIVKIILVISYTDRDRIQHKTAYLISGFFIVLSLNYMPIVI